MAVDEFGLIAHYFSGRGASRPDVQLGIGDDCALLQPHPGSLLAVTTDTLIAGVHFPPDDPPHAIGHKAVAVNLSDLAAMGADPAWISLAISLPSAQPEWLQRFAQGVDEICRYHDVALVGGDTTRGPLAITITAQGWVPEGKALKRSGARPGDGIYVSGTLGEAAAGLALVQQRLELAKAEREPLLQRLRYPTPRVALGRELRGLATAAIDISDGLVADLGHILRASAVDAEIHLELLPAVTLADPQQALDWALAGGDDYELCFTVPPELRGRLETVVARLGLPVAYIGDVTHKGLGKLSLRHHGERVEHQLRPYNHFPES